MTLPAAPSGPAGASACPPPRRRGACPSLASPLQTGDGLLVRLRPVAAGLTPAQWARLATLARTLGNGLLEVTARGSLQLRGLDRRSAPLLAGALDEAGLAFRSDDVAIETPPLSGLDPTEIADARPLAERIRRSLAARRPRLRLAPKLSLVVDGGGRLGLSTMNADLRLDAVRSGADADRLWRVALAGDAFSARPVAWLPEAAAAAEIVALLEALAAAGPGARGRDILEQVAPAAECLRLPVPAFAEPWDPVGPLDLGGLRVLGLRPLHGRMQAEDLVAVMTGLAALGATEVRLSPGRALLVLGLAREATEAALALARERGFLVDPASPANAIAACPGTRLCAAARLDTRRVAEALIAAAPSLLDRSSSVHVSGCPKGCAHAAAATLTIVGTEAGAGFVVAGRAADAPDGCAEPQELRAVLSRIEALIRRRRRPGEATGALLERLGPGELRALIEGRA